MAAGGFVNVGRFNATSTGTVDFVVSSGVTGYQTPALAGAVNGTVYSYRAESADLSQWEIGEGAYTSGSVTLARTTVLYNSAGTGTGTGQSGAGTKISFTAAPQVAMTALAGDLLLRSLNLSDVANAATAFTNIKQAASDTATGVLEIAVQSEMEAASSATLAVTPGRQHFHPGVAKYWATLTNSAGTYAVDASYNHTSITDNGVGDITLNIATDFSSANYAAFVTSVAGTIVGIETKLAGSFHANIRNASNAATDGDFNVVAFGDQ